MVPGSLAWGSAVLAAMTILAPSRAALRAMAFPIPRDAPVMNRVFPFSFLGAKITVKGLSLAMAKTHPVFFMLTMAADLNCRF